MDEDAEAGSGSRALPRTGGGASSRVPSPSPPPPPAPNEVSQRVTARPDSPEPGSLDVRLFGRMRVFRNGVEVPLPPRKAATALKLLALSGGVLHKDKLVSELWPGEDTAVGRARLRNVLSKLRRATGVVVQERNDSVTVLDNVRCDVVEFIQLASRALSVVDGVAESRRQVIAAQDLWVGPPLEEDRYEPWAQVPRGRAYDLQQRMWTMLPPRGRPPEV